MRLTHNEKMFLEWKGERPYTVGLAKEYIEYLQESSFSIETKRIKWHACKSAYRKFSEMTEKEYHCEILWLSKQVRFYGSPRKEIERLNDSQFDIVLREAEKHSDKVPLFMLAIRQGNLKITDMTRLRPYPPYPGRISDDLIFRIQNTFNGKKWLFETGGGKQYRRSYVSNQISKYSQIALGYSASAEAMRPPRY